MQPSRGYNDTTTTSGRKNDAWLMATAGWMHRRPYYQIRSESANPLYFSTCSTAAGTQSKISEQKVKQSKNATMKVVSIAILRTGPDVAEPVPVSMACELSSYGFFQRQVRQGIARSQKP